MSYVLCVKLPLSLLGKYFKINTGYLSSLLCWRNLLNELTVNIRPKFGGPLSLFRKVPLNKMSTINLKQSRTYFCLPRTHQLKDPG